MLKYIKGKAWDSNCSNAGRKKKERWIQNKIMQKMFYTVKGEGSYGYAIFTIREAWTKAPFELLTVKNKPQYQNVHGWKFKVQEKCRKGNHPSLFCKSPDYLNTIGGTLKKDADDQTLS